MNRSDKVILGILGGGALLLALNGYMNRDSQTKKQYSPAGLVQIASAVEIYSAPSAGLNQIANAVKEYSAEPTEEAPIDIPKKVSDLEGRISEANKKIEELGKKIEGVVKTEDLEIIKTEYKGLVKDLDDKYEGKIGELDGKLTSYQTANDLAHAGIKQGYETGDAENLKKINEVDSEHDDLTSKLDTKVEKYKTETDTRLTADEERIGDVDDREQKNYAELKEENKEQYLQIGDLKEKVDKERKENLKNPVHLAGRGIGFVLIDVPCGIFNGIGKGIDGLGKAIFNPKEKTEKEKERKVPDSLCDKK